MASVNNTYWRPVERWSPTAFFVGGVLLLVYATLNGLAAFTSTAYLTVEDVVGPVGFALGFVGLLGLYPAIADECRRLARAAAAFAALGAVGFAVITASNVGRLAGVVPDSPNVLFPVLLGMVAVGMLPGYLTFGVASRRAGVHAQLVGLLLGVPALIFCAMLVGGAIGVAPATGEFLISSGQAVAHLTIGYTLRKGIRPEEHDIPTGDVTVG